MKSNVTQVKVTKPMAGQALIAYKDGEGNEHSHLETDATKADAMTDALTAVSKLGVWLPE